MCAENRGVLSDENEKRHTRRGHTPRAEKRQFCTDGAFFHLGTELFFGTFLSVMKKYCQDPMNMEVSHHGGS